MVIVGGGGGGGGGGVRWKPILCIEGSTIIIT